MNKSAISFEYNLQKFSEQTGIFGRPRSAHENVYIDFRFLVGRKNTNSV